MTFNFGSANTATSRNLHFEGGGTAVMGTAAKRGIRMHYAGSLISIHFTVDINVMGTGDTLEGRILKNGASAGFAASLTGSVADGLEVSNTSALGVVTFAAGDYLLANRFLTGASPGQVTTDDMTLSLVVEFDS